MSTSSHPGRNRTLTALAVGLVALGLVLLVGGVGASVLLGDDDPVTVALEPAGAPVSSPFTGSVALREDALAPVSRDDLPGGGGTAVPGSTVGLYGGTLDQQTCDQQQLVDYLVADDSRAKAEAWADVQGIEVDAIETFVADLTAVRLRHDTRVTNHGFEDDRANAYAAVLQAGTAVMVDERGVPRAKCSCGNPLAEPADLDAEADYTGEEWDGFESADVAVVEAGDAVDTFILVGEDGQSFDRPVGTDGTADRRTHSGAGDPGGMGDGGGTTAPAPTEGPQDAPGATGTDAPVLAQIASIAGTSNGPTAPSVVTLPAARITALQTYHWNSAQGAPPGTIGLRASDGTVYGPFRATGSEGQGGVPNAYWTAVTDFEVPAGKYTVVDSQPATWSWAADTGGRGMVTVWGVAGGGAAETAETTDGAAASDGTADRGKDAVRAVRTRFCAGVEEYVDGMRAREASAGAYRVDVRVELDSGAWTARFDVRFPAGSAKVVPADPDSGALLC